MTGTTNTVKREGGRERNERQEHDTKERGERREGSHTKEEGVRGTRVMREKGTRKRE